MAELRGPQTKFELNVLSGPDPEDWYKVHISVVSPPGNWEGFTKVWAPDLGSLTYWLEGLAAGTAIQKLEFLEPELGFSCDEARKAIQIGFSFQLKPTWAGGDQGEPYLLEIPVAEKEVLRAAKSLQKEMGI